MGEIFNLNNKFFQGVEKAIDCIWLNFLWILFCIPVVTVGAATTALYYTVNKVIRNNRGYVGKEFWSSFRSNFKQSTIIWLIDLLLFAFLTYDCYVMYQFAKAGDTLGSFYMVFIVLIAIAVMWSVYLFPYIARFENTTKGILRNTIYIAVSNMPRTIVIFILLLVVWMGVYYSPSIIVVIPSVYMLLKNLIMEKIFRKYMSPEDLAAEEERNKEYSE